MDYSRVVAAISLVVLALPHAAAQYPTASPDKLPGKDTARGVA